MNQRTEFFTRCAGGFEAILVQELKDMNIKRVRPLKGGVAFFGSLKDAYRVCLWSRVASRVLMILNRVDAHDAKILYRSVFDMAWEEHVGVKATIAVYVHGVNEELRNTQFTAMKIKDAVCDRLRELRGQRPNVSSKRPSVLIDVLVRGSRASIALDLSGEPLHRRAYRSDGVQAQAPLKENLAAAIVLDSGWNTACAQSLSFFDPMCGSGTLAIEAALIAADAAPGIMRDYWGFSGWSGHDESLWLQLIDEADERFSRGLKQMPALYACDLDESCIKLSKENAKRAGVEDCIEFKALNASQIASMLHDDTPGIMVVNPPYGERLSCIAELGATYKALAAGLSTLPESWRVSVITSDDSLDAALSLAPIRLSPFFNGRIETQLRHYCLDQSLRSYVELPHVEASSPLKVAVLEKNTEQFVARFRKVAKQRMKWAKRQGIQSYRIYDADLPDYAVSIDMYEDESSSVPQRYVVVVEYAAPQHIDTERAKRRLADVMTVVPEILSVERDRVFLKKRKRERGGSQYRDTTHEATIIHTRESGYLFELDLSSHLDTGLFLDHRLTRGLIGSMAKAKRFLNLFAYTGSASVYAAGGKARSITTVDLSQTYLAWAKRNMEANGFRGSEYEFIRADTLSWLEEEAVRARFYDLVFVDPPTFSNSKAMGETSWSVERDHVELLRRVFQVLAPGGQVVFSCNLRSFKPDTDQLLQLGIRLRDISAKTIPEDFSRNQRIHRCYQFNKESDE